MAEIKIEKKKPVLIWMLSALGVVAVLLFIIMNYAFLEEVAEEPEATTSIIEVNERNAVVIAFVDFIEIDSNRMSLDHAFTNEALFKITDATNAIADDAGYVIKADIDSVKMYADMITKDPFETTHANNIRRACNIITKVLENIQIAKYPGLTNELAELKSATRSINPDILTLDQQDAVISFFNKAAVLLKKMN